MTGSGPRQRETWHDAADEQTALWRWLRTEGGSRWLVAHFGYSTQDYHPDSMELVKSLYSVEESKLAGADPIFVSREMCEVIDAAKQSFQPEPLYPTDFLTASGFMYFEKPFEVLDRFEKPMTIAAISWTPTVNPDRRDELPPKWLDAGAVLSVASGMAITIYSLSKRDLPEMEGLNPAKLIPTHLTPWWFDMSYEGNDFDVNGKPTGAGWWWRITQVSLRLMQQRLAVRRSERPDRTTRRNWKRSGFGGERDVLVVRLRRERDVSAPVEPTGPANYSHRFIVGGHWRLQPYPSEGVIRQIWIAPYEKGPEGAPLVLHPSRVYNWSR